MTTHAQGAGVLLSVKAKGPTTASVAPPDDSKNSSPNCPATRHSRRALDVIAGESSAEQYLGRLQAQQADPEELALIVSMLYGASLLGFCRVIVKALGVRHA